MKPERGKKPKPRNPTAFAAASKASGSWPRRYRRRRWPVPHAKPTRSRFALWRWRICDGEPGRRRRGSAGSGCTSCYWAVRFNAECPDGLIDRSHRQGADATPRSARFCGRGEASTEPWRDGVVRWRLINLVQSVEEFRVSASAATVSQELRALTSQALGAAAALRSESRGGGSVQKSLPGAC